MCGIMRSLAAVDVDMGGNRLHLQVTEISIQTKSILTGREKGQGGVVLSGTMRSPTVFIPPTHLCRYWGWTFSKIQPCNNNIKTTVMSASMGQNRTTGPHWLDKHTHSFISFLNNCFQLDQLLHISHRHMLQHECMFLTYKCNNIWIL